MTAIILKTASGNILRPILFFFGCGRSVIVSAIWRVRVKAVLGLKKTAGYSVYDAAFIIILLFSIRINSFTIPKMAWYFKVVQLSGTEAL